jgi:hypothetical protein
MDQGIDKTALFREHLFSRPSMPIATGRFHPSRNSRRMQDTRIDADRTQCYNQ